MTNIYLVGGAVRDNIMGKVPNDWDFTVVSESFDTMREFLTANHFNIFLETPEYFTIRARFPRNAPEFFPGLFPGESNFIKRPPTADFVLARKEGQYTDGRRPDSVEIGSLHDDLARRDFTVNAIAMDEEGLLIDPFGGANDINLKVLRAVGNAEDRIREDALRAVRAVRFCVTKDFDMDGELEFTLASDWLPELLASVSAERRREELLKMFRHDMWASLHWLEHLSAEFKEALFAGGIWLEPTLKGNVSYYPE